MKSLQGDTKEQWREQLHAKRVELFRERRERVDEVVEYWQEVLGKKHLTKREMKLFIISAENYEPDWIKAPLP